MKPWQNVIRDLRWSRASVETDGRQLFVDPASALTNSDLAVLREYRDEVIAEAAYPALARSYQARKRTEPTWKCRCGRWSVKDTCTWCKAPKPVDQETTDRVDQMR